MNCTVWWIGSRWRHISESCGHVCFHRYEAYIWVPGTRRQVYLGGFATAAQAAIAHDIVALKVKKTPLVTNFPANL